MALRRGRVPRPLPPVLVHDCLRRDVGWLELRGGRLVPAEVAGYLQVLPLLAAGHVLARLLRKDDLRIRVLESRLATGSGQVAELLRGVELLLGEVLVLAVPRPLRVVRPFDLVPSARHIRDVVSNHR